MTQPTPQAQPAQVAPPLPTIPGISIKSSRQILSPQTMIAWLIWAASGYGKTWLAGQLDQLTQKYMGKRTLFIACESAEGGGAATIRNLDVPIYVPKDFTELEKTARALRNDKTIGGVVLDSATEAYKQHIKSVTLKYPSRENVATRQAGVLTRSDYQVAGEITSQLFRHFINLTTVDDPAYRKHLIITAADQTREEDERVVWVGPDLPGRMSREAVQAFQQVGTIFVKPQVVNGVRVANRYLTFAADGVKALKDRFEMFPQEMQLGKGDGPGESLVSLYEKYWLPAVAQAGGAQ